MNDASRANMSAVSGGIIAALVNAILFAAARVVSLTSFNAEALLAQIVGTVLGVTAVNGHLIGTSPSTWAFGLLVKLVLAGIAGWFYAKIFQGVERSGWETGLGVGAVQWLIVGACLGFFPDVGFYGSELGWPTFILLFISQILFGAIVGGLHVPDESTGEARLRRQMPRLQKDKSEAPKKDIAA